jgi:hypothetical protein
MHIQGPATARCAVLTTYHNITPISSSAPNNGVEVNVKHSPNFLPTSMFGIFKIPDQMISLLQNSWHDKLRR